MALFTKYKLDTESRERKNFIKFNPPQRNVMKNNIKTDVRVCTG
jgi:hypothetical protein